MANKQLVEYNRENRKLTALKGMVERDINEYKGFLDQFNEWNKTKANNLDKDNNFLNAMNDKIEELKRVIANINYLIKVNYADVPKSPPKKNKKKK